MIYDGDLKDEEAVLDFLTDEDNMAIPDKIEDVDADLLISIVESDPFVTVIFYDESKASSKALEHVEEIDEETDVFQIRFLRINDKELAEVHWNIFQYVINIFCFKIVSHKIIF